MTTSRRYREFAENRTAEELGLYASEVRGFVLSQADQASRMKLKDKVDWANVDLVSRRCIKKLQKKHDISRQEACEYIHDTYLAAFEMANELEEEED